MGGSADEDYLKVIDGDLKYVFVNAIQELDNKLDEKDREIERVK